MINSSVKEKINMSFNNKTKVGKPCLIKNIIVGATILVAGFGAVLTNNAYQISKSIDQNQAYYESMSDYSAFKTKMDAVPYTDAMFNKDLAAFNYLYKSADMRDIVNKQNFGAFRFTKTVLNNDIDVVKKYFTYNRNIDDFTLFLMSPSYVQQKNYMKEHFEQTYQKKYDNDHNQFIIQKMNADPSVTPGYINNNIKKYLDEKGLPYDLVTGYNQRSSNLANMSDAQMQENIKNNESKFLDYMNNMNEGQLRDLFKMYNSYLVLIGLRDNMDSYRNFLSNDYYMFDSSELMDAQRYIFNKIESIKKHVTFNGNNESDRESYKY